MTKSIDENEADALLQLYNWLADQSRKNGDIGMAFVDMDDDERRAYMREAKAKSRAKTRAEDGSGLPAHNAENVRQALADAAIIMIRDGTDGSSELLRLLGQAFDHAPGVPVTTRQKIVSGRLKPRLFKGFKAPMFIRKKQRAEALKKLEEGSGKLK